VHLLLLLGRLTDVHRPRRVRSVAVLESTEVENHHVAVLDHPVTNLVVGIGPVGSRANDREVHLRVAEFTQ
jgi:hypothetical protein